MGKRSTEKCTCRVILSVTNAFVDMIKSSVKDANVGAKIAEKTWGCAKLVDEEWREDGGVMKAVGNALGVIGRFIPPVVVAEKVSYTYIYITYYIEVDMFQLVSNKVRRASTSPLVNGLIHKSRMHRAAAHLMKKFPARRRRLVYREMQQEIEKEFLAEIARQAGLMSGLSDAAVMVKSVRVTTL